MNDPVKLKSMAYSGTVSIFKENDSRINPFKYIENSKNEILHKSILKIVPKINLKKINNFLDKLQKASLISETQYNFYEKVLKMRYEDKFMPLFNKFHNLEIQKNTGKHCSSHPEMLKMRPYGKIQP